MPQAVFDRVRLDVCGDLVEKRLVGKGVLQPRGRPKRPGEERRIHRVREHALAAHLPRAAAGTADAAGDVRWRRVAAVPEAVGGVARLAPLADTVGFEPDE